MDLHVFNIFWLTDTDTDTSAQGGQALYLLILLTTSSAKQLQNSMCSMGIFLIDRSPRP